MSLKCSSINLLWSSDFCLRRRKNHRDTQREKDRDRAVQMGGV